MERVKKIGLFLSRPDMFFYTLIWLMILLSVGTVAQKYVGLYAAQQRYFASFIVWAGPLPLPGGMLTMAVIALGLLSKLVFASPWHWKNSGIIITHIGALLLLGGGLITAFHSTEGSMMIFEGQGADFFSDYHQREFVVENTVTRERLVSLPWKDIRPGAVLDVPPIKASVEILKVCRNCVVSERKVAPDDPMLKEMRGHARDVDFEPAPIEKEDAENRAGVLLRLKGAGEADGVYAAFDFTDENPRFSAGGASYRLDLRRARTYVPFEIQLTDFEKQYYPGTDMPRSFKSDIVLVDGDSEWRGVVQMNEPLRYRGYVFYQSSYVDTGEKEATVFAVVKNTGRLFPYISSIVMCIGLLAHMFIHIPRLIKKA
jgi:hypothetical protein